MLSESPKAVSRGAATRLRTPCLDILPVPENHSKMPNFVDVQNVMLPCPALPIQPWTHSHRAVTAWLVCLKTSCISPACLGSALGGLVGVVSTQLPQAMRCK